MTNAPSGISQPDRASWSFEDRRRWFEELVARELFGTIAELVHTLPPGAVSRAPTAFVTDSGPRGYTRPDAFILDDIARQLALDTTLEAAEIEIACADGVVTLSGSVPRREDKSRIEALALATFGVSGVELAGLEVIRIVDAPDESLLIARSEGTSHALKRAT